MEVAVAVAVAMAVAVEMAVAVVVAENSIARGKKHAAVKVKL
jgi:hypothetical protein